MAFLDYKLLIVKHNNLAFVGTCNGGSKTSCGRENNWLPEMSTANPHTCEMCCLTE